MQRCDEASTFANTQVGTCGQHKLRIDEDVAFRHVAVGIGQQFDIPTVVRVFNRRETSVHST